MRTIIAGSRPPKDFELKIEHYQWFSKIINKYKSDISRIISGGARGIDQFAIKYAKENEIPINIIHPDWETFGRKAGIYRNSQMVYIAEALIAVWNGKSKGTLNTVNLSLKSDNIRKIHIIKFDWTI